MCGPRGSGGLATPSPQEVVSELVNPTFGEQRFGDPPSRKNSTKCECRGASSKHAPHMHLAALPCPVHPPRAAAALAS